MECAKILNVDLLMILIMWGGKNMNEILFLSFKIVGLTLISVVIFIILLWLVSWAYWKLYDD